MIRALLPLPENHVRLALVAAAGVLAVALLAASVYGMLRFPGNASDARCGLALNLAKRVAPLVHGEIAAFAVAEQGLLLPDFIFGLAGRTHEAGDTGGRARQEGPGPRVGGARHRRPRTSRGG